jgi:hypothetical protein
MSAVISSKFYLQTPKDQTNIHAMFPIISLIKIGIIAPKQPIILRLVIKTILKIIMLTIQNKSNSLKTPSQKQENLRKDSYKKQ